MTAIRRGLLLTVIALGALTALPAVADADEDAVARNLEAFRTAQAALNASALTALSAPLATSFALHIALE